MEDIDRSVHEDQSNDGDQVTEDARIPSADPWLIVKSEQLLQIKLYVAKGESLPLDRDGIEDVLGGVIDHPKFDWTDIHELHVNIKNHTATWPPIERGLIEVAGDLSDVASGLMSFGDDLVSLINEMPIMERLTSFSEVELGSLPPVSFGGEDIKVHRDLGELFLDLKNSIEEASLRTLALRDLIGTFSTVLSKQLLTLLAAKLVKLGKIDFAIGAEEFRDALAEVEQNISQTKNEIDKHLMFKALGNGSSLVLILESLFSGPTEAVYGRAGLEAMAKLRGFEKERRRLIGLIDGHEKLPGLILSYVNALENLDALMRDAATASKALALVWGLILSGIEKSASEFALIKDDISLNRFKLGFKRGLTPWVKVDQLSSSLLKSLRNAIEEFDKQQSVERTGEQ